ncbi:ribbon-helix-helix domain-containing protein [Acidianus manzaensis]|nr:ribbon-helix-helix domain-containing protein [Acidianus manzaensis]
MISSNDLERIDKLALQQGLTRSDIIRQAIRDYLLKEASEL